MDLDEQLRILKVEKGKKYTVEPAFEVPLETLEHQILIKAHRLMRAIDKEDKVDNAKDLIVYTKIWLNRMQEGRK